MIELQRINLCAFGIFIEICPKKPGISTGPNTKFNNSNLSLSCLLYPDVDFIVNHAHRVCFNFIIFAAKALS